MNTSFGSLTALSCGEKSRKTSGTRVQVDQQIKLLKMRVYKRLIALDIRKRTVLNIGG